MIHSRRLPVLLPVFLASSWVSIIMIHSIIERRGIGMVSIHQSYWICVSFWIHQWDMIVWYNNRQQSEVKYRLPKKRGFLCIRETPKSCWLVRKVTTTTKTANFENIYTSRSSEQRCSHKNLWGVLPLNEILYFLSKLKTINISFYFQKSLFY